MTLLSHAEQIDPDNLTDYFWMAASRHTGPLGNAWSPDQREEKDADQQARLGILLARYNTPSELVRQVMDPVFTYWQKRVGKDASSRFTDYQATFVGMALADPDRAGKWAVEFEKGLNEDNRSYIPQPWEVIANTLTKDRDQISKYITRQVFHRWIIDEYDN